MNEYTPQAETGLSNGSGIVTGPSEQSFVEPQYVPVRKVWTKERRARLSESMKESHRRRRIKRMRIATKGETSAMVEINREIAKHREAITLLINAKKLLHG